MPLATLSPKRKLRTIVTITLVVACLGLLVYSGYGLYTRWNRTHGVVVAKPVATQTDTPTEKHVASTYSVPADQPKLIRLPTIGASGFIQQVSVTEDNAMGTPDNVFMAGWYNRSVKPGEKGLSIIDGHVLGYYRPAIFKNLSQLKTNDTFSVTFGDDSVRTFTIVRVGNYSEAEAQKPLLAHDPSIISQLNLITCAGTFDKTHRTYDRRTIVVAKLVSPSPR